MGGKKKEDKIIPGCYVDLLLIVAFFFLSHHDNQVNYYLSAVENRTFDYPLGLEKAV